MVKIEVKIDYAPKDEKEFEEWCKKYDFAFIGFEHGRKAWCPQFQTYFRNALGIATTLTGESFIICKEDFV